MLADIWRFTLDALDVRTWVRRLSGQPEIDVVFITNLRDEAERRRFFGKRPPRLGHANGPRIHLDGVCGRVRGIYVTAEEMLSKSGRKLAKAHFMSAVAWAQARGAKVVLLAASTKRLFGRDGAELKARFPDLLFTIGDNGTAGMLSKDVMRALMTAQLLPSRSRLMVIGPYGILGACVTRTLVEAGYQLIGYGANAAALAGTAAEFGVETTTDIRMAGQVDAVIACTHSAAAKLSVEDVERLRRSGRKLLVVDVAEPANLDIETFRVCCETVVRQDAGNAYSARLRYVLGALSWRKLILARGVVFGCFGEALALFRAIYRLGQLDLAGRDWFEISPENLRCAADIMAEAGFDVPEPRCFGDRVMSFDLALPVATSAPDNRLETPQKEAA